VFEDRRYAAKADEDGGGGDEEYEIKALRKTGAVTEEIAR